MWKREAGGLTLTFRLAGINNQNFLMRDEQTGTFWQQISGRAIAGPLAGQQLELIPSDELTLGLWRAERPNGTLLRDSAKDAGFYAKKDWEARMQKVPTVLSYAGSGMMPRTLVLGVVVSGKARAYPHDVVLKEKLLQDRLGGLPIALVAGPDNQSIRGFQAQLPGSGEPLALYRIAGDSDAIMLDDATGSRWNFQGCAVTGKSTGTCLARLDIIKDYWFDWRHYHPATTVFHQSR